MNITEFTDVLLKKLKDYEAVLPASDLTQTTKALNFTRELLNELRQFTSTYVFSTKEEEVNFFKNGKPVMLSQYYFYKNKLALQLFDSLRDRKSRMKNYHNTLRKIQRFTEKNRCFYEYCISGSTYLDTHYFTRNDSPRSRVNEDVYFSSRYDNKFSKVIANELIRLYVQDAIASLREHTEFVKLQWTYQKVALVELIYALHATGVLNNGKSDIKEIVRLFEKAFVIDLGNYSRVFSEIRIRKKGTTSFIDKLKDQLEKRMDELD